MGTIYLILIVMAGILVETVGNGLLYGIFLYEKYGVDSMRRTTVNMLYSQICLMLIISNILAFPLAIYGYCLNEISGKLVQVNI